MAEGLKKVKILVLGDPGVGKSSLVHILCHGEVLSNPTWTVGCSVEVKLHDHGRTPAMSQSYFLEFWDVGGSPSHKRGRSVFYQNTNGVILVHDLTNRKSRANLSKWLTELQESLGGGGGGAGASRRSSRGLLNESRNTSSSDLQYDPERFADLDIPLLIVGTKSDQPSLVKSASSGEAGAMCINVDCRNIRQFTVDSQQAIEFNKFFDKVIEHRFLPSYHLASSQSGGGERHRPVSRRVSGTS